MSDAHNSTTTIPYLPGVRPLQWDFPRTPPRPYSREAFFTNPDARLRPREPLIGPQLYFTQEPKKLAVNQWNFPEINAEFLRIRSALGLHEYNLFIIPDYPNGATVRYNSKEVLIGTNFLNDLNYDGIRWVLGHELGHELGHAWRFNHQKAPHLRSALPLKRDGHVSEVEADIIAACLDGNISRTLRGMEVLNAKNDGQLHPSAENRRAYVQNTPLAQCAILSIHGDDDAWMGVPHRLPKIKPAPANKKARE
ncbi:MAG: hypothetical protein DI582_06610 [Azospirillum brasilense]|nr:MAG: hypothetical protein DI582_06610 [Azospirillum brasilense]